MSPYLSSISKPLFLFQFGEFVKDYSLYVLCLRYLTTIHIEDPTSNLYVSVTLTSHSFQNNETKTFRLI